jgi:hypothetical protein
VKQVFAAGHATP